MSAVRITGLSFCKSLSRSLSSGIWPGW